MLTADDLARMRRLVNEHGILTKPDALALLRGYEAARVFADAEVARVKRVVVLEAGE